MEKKKNPKGLWKLWKTLWGKSECFFESPEKVRVFSGFIFGFGAARRLFQALKNSIQQVEWQSESQRKKAVSIGRENRETMETAGGKR